MKPAPSSARTRRQHGAADRPTRCARLGVGQARIGLQFRQDGDVEFVEFFHSSIVSRKDLSETRVNTAWKRKDISGRPAYTGMQTKPAPPGAQPCPRPQGRGTPDDDGETTMNAPLPEHIRRALETVSLDDKYTLPEGRAFMSGVQALVRLPMLQRQRDARAGLNTAGFISGYRGSPLGGYDQALWAARKHLAQNQVVFQPGVNEEAGRHRRVGHAAGSTCTPTRRSSTASSASGTARARAWTAAPTCSSTPTWPARRSTAA